MASKWNLSSLPPRDQFDWYDPNGVLYGHYWQQLTPAWNERLVAEKNLHLSELEAQNDFVKPIDTERFNNLITGKNTTILDQFASEIEKFQFISEVVGGSFILNSSFDKEGQIASNLLVPDLLGTSLALPELGFTGPLFASKQDFLPSYLTVGLWFNEWQQYAREYKYKEIGPWTVSASEPPERDYEQLEFRKLEVSVSQENSGTSTRQIFIRVNNAIVKNETVPSPELSFEQVRQLADDEFADTYNTYNTDADYISTPTINLSADMQTNVINDETNPSEPFRSIGCIYWDIRITPKAVKAPADAIFWIPKLWKYGYYGDVDGDTSTFNNYGLGFTENEIIKDELIRDGSNRVLIDFGSRPLITNIPNPGNTGGLASVYDMQFNCLSAFDSDYDNYRPASIFEDFDLNDGSVFEYYTE